MSGVIAVWQDCMVGYGPTLPVGIVGGLARAGVLLLLGRTHLTNLIVESSPHHRVWAAFCRLRRTSAPGFTDGLGSHLPHIHSAQVIADVG